MAATFVGAPSVLQAQWSASERDQLAQQMDDAAANVDPDKFPGLDEASQNVSASMAKAEEFLVRQTDAENAAAWLQYLDFGPLRDILGTEDSAVAAAREAIDMRYRLVGTTPGLELTVLRNLRSDLEQLIEAVRLRDPDRAKDLVAKQMTAIAEKIREMDDSPSADDVSTLGAVIGLLKSSGQADDVVQSVRNRFGRPNMAVLVGESTVQSLVNRAVDQTRPVRDCILGTRIVGNASLNGFVTADLVPALGEFQIQVALTGCVSSINTGYNGPVVLRTSGVGSVYVSRVLHIRESGVAADPAMVQASLRTNIDAIEHRMRLVRRIARKKAAEQKPGADRIAVEKLRTQVGAQFVKETDQASAITAPDVLAKVRPILKRLSLDEPTRTLGSTDQELFIDSTLRRSDQLASVVSRPFISNAFDAAVQIHESAIDNAVMPMLAGRTLREGELAGFVENTGLKIDPKPVAATEDESAEDDDEEPFEITFARLRPVIFEARDQTLRVGVRGTRFAQGSRELKRTMEITAVYEPARTEDGTMLLLRKDDVEVTFPGSGNRLSVSQAGLKRTIQNKFAKVFPEVLLDRTLTVPATVEMEALRGRSYRPEVIDAKDGWLSIGVAAIN
ncbi:hypothetical protein [Rubripirellula lacrimiformis]|uniref:hypothetical protein n=1 Tax=Rubripirellula lacrimiformis TaxID=1930273 RepID=UPI00119E3022|nr:hypothetical protein [Rubripirellula lacrimiformis]